MAIAVLFIQQKCILKHPNTTGRGASELLVVGLVNLLHRSVIHFCGGHNTRETFIVYVLLLSFYRLTPRAPPCLLILLSVSHWDSLCFCLDDGVEIERR